MARRSRVRLWVYGMYELTIDSLIIVYYGITGDLGSSLAIRGDPDITVALREVLGFFQVKEPVGAVLAALHWMFVGVLDGISPCIGEKSLAPGMEVTLSRAEDHNFGLEDLLP